MAIPGWEEIGIPEGFGPYRLLYNPHSETVIVELRSIGEQFFPNRAYIRRKDSIRYEPLKDVEQMVSSESIVTSLGHPLLFYLSNRFRKTEKGFGGEWEGIYSFDLQERTHLKIVDKSSLRLPAPYVQGWVTSLIAVSADAREVYLTLGMMRPEGGLVNHQLARLDLRSHDISSISQLKGVFF
jgi:hypothetical protein